MPAGIDTVSIPVSISILYDCMRDDSTHPMCTISSEQQDQDDAHTLVQSVESIDCNQLAGVRERSLEVETKKLQGDMHEQWLGRHVWLCGPRCDISLAALLFTLAMFGSYQLWAWFHPVPIHCTLDRIRPQKFKVDITEFFTPRVSAALQLVLSLRNSNMLQSMLLEQCKLTAYEDETGAKLGSTQQGPLVLSPLSTMQLTVALNSLAGSLPQPEQRRLASASHTLDPSTCRLRNTRRD